MENIMEDPWNINAFNTIFFDSHMTLTMLKWLKQKSEYNPKSILQAMKEVYKNTLLLNDYQNVIEESASPEMLSQASKMKAEFISIESHLGGFLSCMISVRRERQESDTVTVSDRKTIQEWSILMRNKQKKAFESDITKDGSFCSEKEEFADFPENVLELLLRYSYLFYASGEYSLSKRWLLFYLDHVFEFTIEGRDRTDLRLKCLWGLIASSIMCLPPVETVSVAMDSAPYNAADVEPINSTVPQDENIDGAYTIPRSILIIVDYLESSRKNHKVATLERIWLIVWSIWGLNRYYFPRLLNNKNGGVSFGVRGLIPGHMEWTRLTDWLFSEQILSIIGTFAPHLLRYIAVIAILNKQRQDHFKATVDIISKTYLKTPDHFVSIIESLFLKFDIEQAQDKLAYCEKAAKADFLLVPLEKLIEEHSRLLIFQTYCRIQKSIDIDMMAKKLNMTAETAERWIVNLIRTARLGTHAFGLRKQIQFLIGSTCYDLEAKIDSERNRVEITSPVTNAYQEVLDKARNLVARSNVLIHNIEKISISPSAPSTNRNNYSNFGRPLLRIGNNPVDQRNVVKDIELSGLFVRKNLVN